MARRHYRYLCGIHHPSLRVTVPLLPVGIDSVLAGRGLILSIGIVVSRKAVGVSLCHCAAGYARDTEAPDLLHSLTLYLYLRVGLCGSVLLDTGSGNIKIS